MSEERIPVEVEGWDGRPRHALTLHEMLALYAFVPRWSGVAFGPPAPFGNGQHAQVLVDAIFDATREGAENIMWWQVEQACIAQGMVFDKDDWTLVRLVLLDGS